LIFKMITKSTVKCPQFIYEKLNNNYEFNNSNSEEEYSSYLIKQVIKSKILNKSYIKLKHIRKQHSIKLIREFQKISKIVGDKFVHCYVGVKNNKHQKLSPDLNHWKSDKFIVYWR